MYGTIQTTEVFETLSKRFSDLKTEEICHLVVAASGFYGGSQIELANQRSETIKKHEQRIDTLQREIAHLKNVLAAVAAEDRTGGTYTTRSKRTGSRARGHSDSKDG